jgi:hypothetical protein
MNFVEYGPDECRKCLEVAGELHLTRVRGKATVQNTISLHSRKVFAHFFEAQYKSVTQEESTDRRRIGIFA